MMKISRAGLLPPAWAGAIVASEILGRRSPSDLWDAVGVLVFAVLTGFTVSEVLIADGRAAAWLDRTAGELVRIVRSWWPEMGVDFRGKPPLPRRFPSSLLGVIAPVATFSAAAFALRQLFPATLRLALLEVSPTAYFIGLGLSWTALLALLVASAGSTWLDLHDRLWNAGVPGPRYHWIESLAGLAWLGLLTVLVFLVPIWICWIVIGATAALGISAGIGIIRHEPLLIVWRRRGSDSAAVFSAASAIGWNCLFIACVMLAVGIPATGTGWSGALASTTPITIGLGSAALWAGTVSFVSWSVHHVVRTRWVARHDPSIRRPITLRIEGPAEIPADVLRRLKEHGFRSVSSPNGAEDDFGLTLRLEPEGPRRAVETRDTRGRITVHVRPEALLEPSALAELRRVDTESRRIFLRDGVRRLLRIAAGRRYDSGSGFWIAPHLWWIWGLTRDDDDGDFWTIGPPYYKQFPLPVR